jgi:hypothetical protein
MNEANETNSTPIPDWVIPIFLVGVICAFVFGIGFWVQSRVKTVVSTKDAGVMLSAKFTTGGFISDATTTIDTSKGTFAVYGTFQIMKGNKAVIETRKNGDLYLCDHSESICKLLID